MSPVPVTKDCVHIRGYPSIGEEHNMPKHVGIVACSAEGAALCYRTFCKKHPAIMGDHMHPEISMHTHPLGEYMIHIRRGDWAQVAELMLSSARKLAQIGAQFAICPDNTIHEAFEFMISRSPDSLASHCGSRCKGGEKQRIRDSCAHRHQVSYDRACLSPRSREIRAFLQDS